jgi:peptidoglycan/LPS O-acetylase OafA/YrhL
LKNNNFDFLRLFLASSVVWHHFLLLTQQTITFFPFDIIDRELAVKAFFVISGALIWASANRTEEAFTYVKKRFFRVYPAYIFVLLISAIVSFLHFSAGVNEILSYLFWNSLFLNFVQPCIGEMFGNNLICAVNGSLWTLKLEVGFYIFVGLCVFAFKKRAISILVVFTLVSILLSLIFTYVMSDLIPKVYLHQLPFMFFYFGLGALLFPFYRDASLNVNNFIFIVASILYYVSELFYPVFVISFVYFIAYGLPFKIELSKIGDLSYGAYIFHFPIIQLFIALNIFTGDKHLDVAVVFIIVYVFSYFSWHIVEKPSIKLSHRKPL